MAWTATKTLELRVAVNGGKIIKKAKPLTAWPYYRALRRLLNWVVILKLGSYFGFGGISDYNG